MNQDVTKQNASQLIQVISTIDHRKIEEIAKLIKSTIYNPVTRQKTGRKLLICGNGGSAAQADHMMGELIGRYKDDRTPFPCLNLAASAATTTCITNDYGGDYIFTRNLEALGEEGDILMVLTTSGYSKNIMEAVTKAKELGIKTVSLLGQKRDPKHPYQKAVHGLADYEIEIPSLSTARTQEAHIFILHSICDYLEKFSLENGN
ncbi:hypothetical protein CO038_03100 [Candidatus Pacearchaeota archaeon CG_4_9_14_0_2_um_filter_39_13]|nr:SIS domain-containing protein [Candidatus Pacearchaeota archaeon]OIO42143.1 MAG: hypothetical protein AUJ64_04205 [Candidatus Pacearchaeota archaeon CG1_02_39_14]PJC44554.1 MAG: hypothetical protein CO038_03100 [Candidatus Pacearchaeota archaeon CG_4_9_14_0_2_um_filter_39_13]